MVKRNVSGNNRKSKLSQLPNVDSDDDFQQDESHFSVFDEVDEFDRQDDKILLDRINRQEVEDDEERGVFDIESEDDKSDANVSEDDLSDIDDSANLPDSRAWGRKKSTYYSTDYVDEDFGGFRESEIEAAELEEQEARNIQQQLVEQLEETDFSLDLLVPAKKEQEADQVEEVISADLSKLSKRQKLQVLQKESPEFFGLVDDFKEKMTELCDVYYPLFELLKQYNIPDSPAVEYVKTKYQLMLNYCTNISFYLLLKINHVPVQSHPVIPRLFQFRQLLRKLEEVDGEMKPQIDTLLEMGKSGEGIIPKQQTQQEIAKSKTTSKLLKMLSKQALDLDESVSVKNSAKLGGDVSVEEEPLGETEAASENSEDAEVNDQEMEQGDESAEAKRGITYQIAKNKGLTPHRKKELRNPRVKHRMKYRKAKIRRKGQVREYRPELQKYGGEISGIKIGVKKSIKLK